MFIQDRDLLPLEPSLFRDVSWLGQQLFRGQAKVTGGELLATEGDLIASAIQPGHVLLAGDLPLEIIEVTSSASAVVSLPRASAAAAVRPPADFDSRLCVVTTFAPQTALVHGQLLAMLELEPWRQDLDPLAPGEASILNPAEFVLIEALGTLHQVFSAAAAIPGPESLAHLRAQMYRERFAQERWRVRASLDLNGDGRPDAVRALNVAHLRR